MLHAHNRDAHTLELHLARNNAPMLAIVRRSATAVRDEGGDAVAHLTLPHDTLRSCRGALGESSAAEPDCRLERGLLRRRARMGLSTPLPPAAHCPWPSA